MKSELVKAGWCGWLLALLVLQGGATRAIAADPVVAERGSPEPVLSVELEYTEVPYSVASLGILVSPRSGAAGQAFAKEPDTGSKNLVRQSLQIAGEPMGFLWDRPQRKLYLDLNRNQDLTDDPAGVFTATSAGFSQVFTNVHLEARQPEGAYRFLVDLNLYSQGTSAGGYAMLRSFYQGKMEALGKVWQVAVIQDWFTQTPARTDVRREGHLLLRSWEDRERGFSLFSDSVNAVTGESVDVVTLPRKLFVQEKAFATSLEPLGDPLRLKLEFKPQQPSLGELRLTGQYIHRLVLEAQGEYTVLLDEPPASVRIPIGDYALSRVRLKQGDAEAQGESQNRLAISPAAAATLALGGPLTNSVEVNRNGAILRLNYRVVGAGGRTYRLARQDRSNPPEFAVYKGDRRLAGGKFEFG